MSKPITAPETEPKKVKIQKRTPTERQLEQLEKARQSRLKKKIIKEHEQNNKPESNSFLLPSPYLVGTIFLGLGGLVAYSWLKQEESSPTSQEFFGKPQVIQSKPPTRVSVKPTTVWEKEIPIEKPKEVKETKEVKKKENPRTQEFFKNSTVI
jgi:hypothetical protein